MGQALLMAILALWLSVGVGPAAAAPPGGRGGPGDPPGRVARLAPACALAATRPGRPGVPPMVRRQLAG